MAEYQQREQTTSTEKERLKTNMLNKLVHTDAHFKHQQIGEPDLDIEEKRTIASSLLEKSDALFLERFSNYLTVEDTAYFSDHKEDYQITFYIDLIKKHSNVNKNQNMIKNRRYQALQEMIKEGEYFSDTEMQRRDPLLFDQMIGQHETEEEKQAREVDKTDMRFSSILLRYMDIQETKHCYDKLKDKEEGQEEEEEDSDEEDEGNEAEFESKAEEEAKDKISPQEQGQLRSEFVCIMQERFLAGEDKEFDYSKVDDNADYDSFAILNQDAEDKYFDDDDDSTGPSRNLKMDTV